jgi:hypothetical protein
MDLATPLPNVEVVVEVVEECPTMGKWVEGASSPELPPGKEATPPTPPSGETLLGTEMTGEVLQVLLGQKGRERCHGGGREWERIGEVRDNQTLIPSLGISPVEGLDMGLASPRPYLQS